jgi:hypothetical protein
MTTIIPPATPTKDAYATAQTALLLASIAANTVATYANGIIIAPISAINFNNSASVTVQATINANSNSVNSNVVDISFTSFGGNGGGSSANTVTVLANDTIVVANALVNFNNTATINVNASANGTYESNISFSANGTSLGIPAINVALGTMNAAIVVALNDAEAAYGQANLAYAQANSQGTYANGTIVVANIANLNFNNTATVNVSVIANGSQSNIALSANGTALGIPAINAALAVMNAATVVALNDAEAAYGQANLAYTQANNAYAAANAAANTVAVYANDTLTIADANINFNNTATINVSSTVSGATMANVAFSVNLSAIAQSDNNYEVDILANGSLVIANANLNFNNTSTVNVSIGANGTSQANIAFAVNLSAIDAATSAEVDAVGEVANNALAYGLQGVVNIYPLANTASSTANAAYGQANNAYARANAFGVWANSGLILANTINLAFYNTATVNAIAVSNTPNGANVAFSVNVASTDWASGANAAAQTTFATDNTTFGTINTTFVTINTTFAAHNTTFGVINTSLGTMNSVIQKVNAVSDIANTAEAYGLVSVVDIYPLANAASTQANSAANTANNALSYALLAMTTNAVQHTVATSQNGSQILAAANLNFNNTATVTWTITANGTGQVNIAATGAASGGGGGPNYNVAQTATSVTMTAGEALFVNTNSLIITLPSVPGAGNVCAVATGSGVTNTLINAVTIMGATGNLTIDSANVTVVFTYFNSTVGWILG